MRIVFMNNYDALRHERLWQAEPHRYPSHHLWGVPQLRAAGHEVEILPFADDDTKRSFGRHVGVLGDPHQQRLALARRRGLDLVYAAHQNSALGLAGLRRLRLLGVPVVGMLHRSYPPSAATRAFVHGLLAGYDRILVFSELVRDRLCADFGVPAWKVPVLDWGMDLAAVPAEAAEAPPAPEPFVLSVGKTFRDFPTMIEAHRRTGVALKAIGWSTVPDPEGRPLPPGIEVEEKAVHWPDLAPLYRACAAVAIPVDPVRALGFANTCGLTSLLDAMAYGRPVIMTRTTGQAIDVEREGIGLHVEPGDADGWTRALETLVRDPAAAREMGRRGRRLAEERFNIDRFSRQLEEVAREVVSAGRGRRVRRPAPQPSPAA